jgi:hypothetical protein
MSVWSRKGKDYDVGEPQELRKLTQTLVGSGPFVLRHEAAVFKLRFEEAPYRGGVRVDAALTGVWRVVDMADSDGVPGLHATRNDVTIKASRILVADQDLQGKMDTLRRQGRRDLVAELLERAEKALKPAAGRS